MVEESTVFGKAIGDTDTKREARMLDETQDIYRIFKVEIAREVGRFDAWRQLLTPPFEGNLARVADLIRGRADAGDRDVWPIAF